MPDVLIRRFWIFISANEGFLVDAHDQLDFAQDSKQEIKVGKARTLMNKASFLCIKVATARLKLLGLRSTRNLTLYQWSLKGYLCVLVLGRYSSTGHISYAVYGKTCSCRMQVVFRL